MSRVARCDALATYAAFGDGAFGEWYFKNLAKLIPSPFIWAV